MFGYTFLQKKDDSPVKPNCNVLLETFFLIVLYESMTLLHIFLCYVKLETLAFSWKMKNEENFSVNYFVYLSCRLKEKNNARIPLMKLIDPEDDMNIVGLLSSNGPAKNIPNFRLKRISYISF